MHFSAALYDTRDAISGILPPGSTSITGIANGDPVVIHGIATGYPRDGLQIWGLVKIMLKFPAFR